MFTVTADWKVVLGAQPHGAYHAKYPFGVIELEPDAYAVGNRGMPEILSHVQQTMDWLVNTHFYNVRASLNNLLIVDPMRVVMKDITEGKPGGLIRLRPGAAQSTRPPVEQLQVADVTRSHLGDFAGMVDLGARASGVGDQMQGVPDRRGRRPATQVRTESVAAVSRQKVIAEFISSSGWEDVAEIMLANSQQYFDQELTLKIVGNLAQFGGSSRV